MISIVVALYKHRGIGKNNTQPIYISEDLKRFAKLTRGHSIIMGRRTYEAILAFRGQPLPDKTSIVITRDTNFSVDVYENVVVTNSVEEAIEKGQKLSPDEVFIIGGGQIFEQGIKYANRLYITLVDYDAKADVFFPDYSEFTKKVDETDWMESSAGPKYKYITLERQSQTDSL